MSLVKTTGISLGYIKYKESSIIAKVFTQELGLVSLIVNGVRSKKSKTGPALFQPGTLLDLILYEKKNGGLLRLSEVKCAYVYSSIPFEFAKSSMIMFITEILTKVLEEHETNAHLFRTTFKNFASLDSTEEDYSNAHIHMVFDIMFSIGISPADSDEFGKQLTRAGYPFRPDSELRKHLSEGLEGEKIKPQNRVLRYDLLLLLTRYMELHYEGCKNLASLKVLQEVLD